MAEKMRAMTNHHDSHGDNDDNDDEGVPSNEVGWEYSVDYCDAAGFASSKFESLWSKRHQRGGTSGGSGSPPRFRFPDVGGGDVLGAMTAINPNGIHEVLERSGVVHRQRKLFPLEPTPELEAKRPPPQEKTTAMGGSGSEMIIAASGVTTVTTASTTTNRKVFAHTDKVVIGEKQSYSSSSSSSV